MLFSTKFFTFSQLPNKFYITKSTTTHTSAATENPPLSTQNPPPHNTEITKTPPPTPPQQQQKKIRDQREKADRRQDRPRGGDRSASGGRRDRPRGGDDLTQRRTRPVKQRQASCGVISAGRSRRREVDDAISPARLGLGHDIAGVFGCVKSKALYSLLFSLSLSLSLFARLSPKMIWNENRNLKQFLG